MRYSLPERFKIEHGFQLLTPRKTTAAPRRRAVSRRSANSSPPHTCLPSQQPGGGGTTARLPCCLPPTTLAVGAVRPPGPPASPWRRHHALAAAAEWTKLAQLPCSATGAIGGGQRLLRVSQLNNCLRWSPASPRTRACDKRVAQGVTMSGLFVAHPESHQSKCPSDQTPRCGCWLLAEAGVLLTACSNAVQRTPLASTRFACRTCPRRRQQCSVQCSVSSVLALCGPCPRRRQQCSVQCSLS